MKTAVEWQYIELSKFINGKSEFTDANDILIKAQEMEKEQIAQAFEDGEHNYFYSKKTGEDFESGIEYYNEKFKKQEQ
jgi:hypothetical protein